MLNLATLRAAAQDARKRGDAARADALTQQAQNEERGAYASVLRRRAAQRKERKNSE
jgi:hypothetical protein